MKDCEIDPGYDVEVSGKMPKQPNKRWLRNQQALVLAKAAEDLLNNYVAFVNSGDCGNWDPETEAEVIALRKALEPFKTSG